MRIPSILGVLCTFCFVSVASAAGFPDVPQDNANYKAILYVQSKGIVEGYPDGTYQPYQTINRAEFVKILAGYMTTEAELSDCRRDVNLATLSDVSVNEWYTKHLCVLVKAEIIHGYPDSTFRPDQSINFVEAAKIIHGAMFRKEGRLPVSPDSSYAPWYQTYVDGLAERLIIPSSIRRLDQKITRGEMAEMIWRLDAEITDQPFQTYGILKRNTEGNGMSLTMDYMLRYRYQTDHNSTDGWDATLLSRDRLTNKERVLVESVKKALPELQDHPNHTLSVFAQPSDSLVILKSVLMDTDNSSGKLYAFDSKLGSLQKMKINEIYDGFYGGFAMSPDEKKFVWIPNTANETGDTKTMYLVDLTNDSYHVLVQLSGNETFNGGAFALSSSFDIKWMNGEVKYAVFDQSKKPSSDYTGKDILIGYRKVQIR